MIWMQFLSFKILLTNVALNTFYINLSFERSLQTAFSNLTYERVLTEAKLRTAPSPELDMKFSQ